MTQRHTSTADLGSPVNLTHMSLNRGRKPEYPERNNLITVLQKLEVREGFAWLIFSWGKIHGENLQN